MHTVKRACFFLQARAIDLPVSHTIGFRTVDFCDCMTVNRVQRVCCFCKYALPVAAVLYLAVNGISCDAVSVYHGDLIPARSHTRVERRDDAIFDGTHDLIRVRHVVDCNSRGLSTPSCRERCRTFYLITYNSGRTSCTESCRSGVFLACRSSAILSSSGSSFPRSLALRRIPRHAFALK